MYKLILLLTLSLLSACASLPEPGIKPINGFDLSRYLGKWHEIARLDHSFERGLIEVSAEYSLREDGGVKVINSGWDVDSQQRDVAEGKAYFVEANDIGRLKVSFFGPFYGAYNIIALDKANYSYVMIASNTRDYLWILSRTANMDVQVLNQLVEQAKALGFPTQDLIYLQAKH